MTKLEKLSAKLNLIIKISSDSHIHSQLTDDEVTVLEDMLYEVEKETLDLAESHLNE